MSLRIECQSCGSLVDVEHASVLPHAVRLVCPNCAFTNEIRTKDSSTPQSSAPIVRAPAASAPYASAPPAPASVQQVSSTKATMDWISKVKIPPTVDDNTWGEFQRVLRDYDDQAQHDAFLAKCVAGDSLANAGGCYRAVLDACPDEPMAKAAQNKILTRAMAMLDTSAFQKEPSSSRGRTLVWIMAIFFVLFCVGVSYVILQKG